MSMHYNELSGPYVDEIVRLASHNLTHGVIEEPRGYFDVLTLNPAGQPTQGTPEVFVNGEQFPVRLLWAAFALVPDFNATPTPIGVDPRLIQRVGARFRFHDTFYMADDFAPCPMWINRVVAAADSVTQASSSIIFDRPVVIADRDSIRVEVALQSAPTTPRTVYVSFTGTGMVSKTPYFFESEVELDDVVPQILNPTGYRNDGVEPVAITTMVVKCSAEEEDAAGVGDIRQLAINVQTIGNGTQANWFRGPQTVAFTLNDIPAQLLGINTGSAIVHRFPGEGVLWEPGQGITVEMQSLNSAADGLSVGLHLFGYISIV